jgi:hypothetical protein
MDMVLLDWTRMGKWYCLAGAVSMAGAYRVVRPLLLKLHDAPMRNVGWSAWLLDGHSRWEVFEIVGPQPAPPDPPHLEDLWVRALRPRRRLATPAERRAILAATRAQPNEDLFGTPLATTRTAAHLLPGMGCRSLATLEVPANRIEFSVTWREGIAEADVRVTLPLPGVGDRILPVKDHHLLLRAERTTPDLKGRVEVLAQAVRQMGATVAVRLGLSRSFQGNPGRAPAACWLMADGFFSATDPEP